MKLILETRELWEVVDGTDAAPAQTDSGYKDWRKRELAARAQILLTLEPDPYTGVIALA
jgi:hypothetical protein